MSLWFLITLLMNIVNESTLDHTDHCAAMSLRALWGRWGATSCQPAYLLAGGARI